MSFRNIFLLRPPVMYSDFTEILSDSAASPGDDENTFRDIFFLYHSRSLSLPLLLHSKKEITVKKKNKNLQRSIAINRSRKRTKSVNLNTF